MESSVLPWFWCVDLENQDSSWGIFGVLISEMTLGERSELPVTVGRLRIAWRLLPSSASEYASEYASEGLLFLTIIYHSLLSLTVKFNFTVKTLLTFSLSDGRNDGFKRKEIELCTDVFLSQCMRDQWLVLDLMFSLFGTTF